MTIRLSKPPLCFVSAVPALGAAVDAVVSVAEEAPFAAAGAAAAAFAAAT